MRTLVVGALLLALAAAPAIARADVPATPLAAVGEAHGRRLAGSAPVADTPGEARDYAAREAAAPELGEFAGGDGAGVYIGGSALVVVLFAVIIVLLI